MPENLRYVVLRHEGIDTPHFDFLIETAPNEPLKSWRSVTWPPDPAQPGEMISVHRREYLEYEGPISENRGHVHRVEFGTFQYSEAKFDIHVYLLSGPPQRKIMMRKTDENKWVMWQV